MRRYDALYGFLAGYLHEDWMEDAESVKSDGLVSPMDLVPEFIAHEGEPAAFRLLGELTVILAGPQSDDELWKLMLRYGTRFDPRAGGRSVRRWLRELAAVVASSLAHRPGSTEPH